MRGLFITGTDTGVGKTILSAALLAAMAADGEAVRAYKPVVTGLDDEAEIAARGQWPADHELLAAVADMDPDDVAPLRYGPAVSPHLAAELAREPIDPALLLAGAARIGAGERAQESGAGEGAQENGAGEGAQENGAGEGAYTFIVEGVGGLLTPLAEDYSVCDFAVALGLPVLIAARAGLGTINHTLLTLRVARTAGLDVRAVVLTPWPQEATELQCSNRSTIGRLGEVAVEGLALVRNPHRTELARAGAEVLGRLARGDGRR